MIRRAFVAPMNVVDTVAVVSRGINAKGSNAAIEIASTVAFIGLFLAFFI
jgi:hypothetical protein